MSICLCCIDCMLGNMSNKYNFAICRLVHEKGSVKWMTYVVFDNNTRTLYLIYQLHTD